MSNTIGSASTTVLNRIIDLLVEHKIRLDALEQVLKETNPLVHELYLGTIDNLRAQRAADLRRELNEAIS